ncbi:AAA family ATPase [Enhygromyxa salina]|uniref:AAA family ATPase n=1 Tax=Enhygromyxa salina TaxID=215803 RepID=UPI0013FD0458|nr:AAA family ATPase [Enhygromyxa salina]
MRSSAHARVYEAVRDADGVVVIAKVFDFGTNDGGPGVDPRVEHEFELIKALDIEGVVKALGLQRIGENLVLLLERASGQDLAEFAQRTPLDLERFFSIAIQISEVLGSVHARRIIHRDIKPTNILIDSETGRVCLANFGISALLDAERRRIYDPAVLADTLPYVSPEQTGRTGRSVDSRSDLYSLGVTFYELLTGRRPFEFPAPLELLHAHLARSPDSPDSLRPELPHGLSRLVMKLLAKAPEHRYQTAVGLAMDLRKLRELIEIGQDGSGLVLGRVDFSRTLQLPHQLYGRMRERHELVDELERVIRTQTGRVLLLEGPPGVGKSSLLADFEGPVAGFGGYLARGKFDGFSELPYSGFVDAFGTLVEQLLTESEERLGHWRAGLTEALGGVGRIVCELVPALELVIGAQPPVPELEPQEARNRLHLAVGRFLSAFCDAERPLVLVLDDLHWADRSSLALLQALIDGGRRGALLILGSFSDRDVCEDHPLRGLIDALINHRRVRLVRLCPLELEAVVSLLADTLARPGAEVQQLAQIVGRKTDNNPLFIEQFLGHLVQQGLLRPGEDGWIWDEAAVEAADIPDDVLDVMTAKLDRLSAQSRSLLARAACIGTRFDLTALEVVTGRPRAEHVPILHELVDTGLLAAVAGEYRFVHDRIKNAAHNHLPGVERRKLHWQLGRDAIERAGEVSDERLFEVVDHLDAGIPSEHDADALDELDGAACLELASLNLRAGNRALDAASYDAALRYFDIGIEFSLEHRESVAAQGPGAPHYDLVVGLAFGRAQALELARRNAEAEDAFAELLGWRLDIANFGRVAARRIRLLTLAERPNEAVALGLEALARCGHVLPPSPSRSRTGVALVRTWLSIRRRTLEELMAIPDCEDPRASAAQEITLASRSAALALDSCLSIVLTCLHVRLFLRAGFHPSCPQALAELAISVGSGLRQVKDAQRLCEQGLALTERLPTSSGVAATEAAAYLFMGHLGRPFVELIAAIDDAYGRALEAGEFESAGFMGALGLSMHFEVGTHLRVLERLSGRLEHDIGRWGSQEMVLVTWMVRGLAVALAGGESERGSESSSAEASDVHTALDPQVIASRGGSRVAVYAATINQALCSVLLGDARAAMELTLELIHDVEKVMRANWMVPRAALICVVATTSEIETRGSVPPQVHAGMVEGMRIIKRWVRYCPGNYAHYGDLVQGLHASLQGRPYRAMRLLERARVHAGAQGCRWVEGLAAERLGDVAARAGLGSFAVGARARAWQAYDAWGARAKLSQLCVAFPEQFDDPASASGTHEIAPPRQRLDISRPRNAGTSAEPLDFESVLQAVSAMTEDLRLDEVVGRVLEAAITNVGADRGLLLLERDGVLGIVAEASVDHELVIFAAPPPASEAAQLCPTTLINFVSRTEQALVISDARTDPRFSGDPYVVRTGVQSLLGMPIFKGKRQLGALVLENRLSASCFTPERLEGLSLIAGQAATALDNARLYTALRRSEARWRSLVDGAPDAIALLNERGEVEFVNRGNSAVAGGGAQLFELFSSSAAATQWRDAVTEVLRDGVERELEIEVEHAHARRRWYVARLAPIQVDPQLGIGPSAGLGGELGPRTRRAVAVATDVTERKQAELERHALEAQLRQQQRLESIGTLASGVAHEINNPVQGILNYAELITDNLHNHSLVCEFAGEITNESNRVASIVRNLLQFSRQEREARMEDTDIAKLIEGTLSLVRAVIRKDHIQIKLDIPTDLPLVHCRFQQIQQIIMNLVANARDALNDVYHGFDERKVITLSVRVREPKPGEQQRWVRIIVEDQGTGIPPDVLPRVFDPFFTSKGRDQGTGLGLSVSHGIANEHGGDLTVETKLGEWTRFNLDLPSV